MPENWTPNMSTRLEPLKAKYQKSLYLLEQIDNAIRTDPDVGRLLRSALNDMYRDSSPIDGTPVRRRRRGRPRTNASRADQISEVLTGKGWTPTPTLSALVGLTKQKLTVAMRAYPERFESKSDPKNERRLLWRLKENAGRPQGEGVPLRPGSGT